MFVHILATDYEYLNVYHGKYEHNLSINAATFGSIVMASRIRSPMFGGALITFGILCFTLSPILRHKIKKFSVIAHVAVTFSLSGIAIGCLLNVPLLAVTFTTAVLFISFIIPWFFVKLQKHAKLQINGPWDEAKPQNSAAAAEWANSGLLS
jgi:phosphatidylinositol glycan class C protein